MSTLNKTILYSNQKTQCALRKHLTTTENLVIVSLQTIHYHFKNYNPTIIKTLNQLEEFFTTTDFQNKIIIIDDLSTLQEWTNEKSINEFNEYFNLPKPINYVSETENFAIHSFTYKKLNSVFELLKNIDCKALLLLADNVLQNDSITNLPYEMPIIKSKNFATLTKNGWNFIFASLMATQFASNSENTFDDIFVQTNPSSSVFASSNFDDKIMTLNTFLKNIS